MAWQAEVIGTEREGNILNIFVVYSTENDYFKDTIKTDQVQSDEWLAGKISARLDELNALDTYEQHVLDTQVVNKKYTHDSQAEDSQLIEQVESIGEK